ncbi:outer membrane lipoprotein-sorting protein [Anaeromyxobacter oryzae]|uniref:Outer membrane lipoprotein-sorting protein n=1 Tax=Anaeromyxobacter oryzae TaxID=2918170 RepID=A0ABM7WZW4_9BACT|nr:outer membrane lipoprotein-sorting protein [Anaeromyxobacter oryzae]BDG05035.1 outer membrane lipoprotein-sorting protein [Anaeromyxobacter oryzae]
MKRSGLLSLLFLSFGIEALPAPGEAATPSAKEIVAAADAVRNPGEPFRVSLALVEFENGNARDAVHLAVHAKVDSATHQYRNVVRYEAPPRDAGKAVLLAGGNMWFYDPASKASIRISPQQRLVGQASDGDVLTVNLDHDYVAKLVGEETVQDADKKSRTVWHLDLVASTGEAAYAHLEYFVEKETYRPVKAKFYSDSGRVLKVAYYRRFDQALGATRPTETIIIDAVDKHLVTVIRYSDYRAEKVEDAWFEREYLPRFAKD